MGASGTGAHGSRADPGPWLVRSAPAPVGAPALAMAPSSTPLGPFGRLASAVLAHRGLALVLAALCLGLSLASALRLRLDFSSAAFYGSDDPEAASLQAFADRWGSDDATLHVLVEADPPGVLDIEPLAAMVALREALAAVPGVVEVVDLDTVTPSLGPGDVPLVQSFETAGGKTHDALRGVMLASPVVPRLLSKDGGHAAMAVRLERSSDDVQAIAPLVARVTAVVREHQGRGGLRLRVAGVPAIRAEFYTLALHDQLWLGPLVGVALALLLWLSLRRLHGVVIPLLLAGVPVAWLVGLMAATDEPIGLLNQAYFTLLPVIAVADAVHLVARMHESLRRHQRDPRDAGLRRAAVLEACDRTGAACLLTSLTTGLGFASLALAPVPMLQRFGLYAALGIGLAYAALLLLGPLLLDAVRAEPPPPRAGMARLARLTTRRLRPRVAVMVALGLAALAALGGRRVQIDNHLGALLPESSPVRQASARIDRHLGGTLSLEVELRGDQPWLEPPQIAAVSDFERWAAQQPEIRTVLGPATVHALVPPFGPLPPEVETLRARVVDATGTRARISLGVPDIGGRAFADLAARVSERAAALPGQATVTGTTLLAYRGVNRIATELRTSLVLVVLVVSVAIGVLLRSLRLLLVALVPNVLPLAVAYGGLGLLGIELDPLAAVILCVALSIAVDDSLHLLARLRQERARGVPAPEALQTAVATSGHAALVTSVALTGGLAVDLASSFPPLQLLGGLGASTIALAWLLDVLVLPGLLRAASREYDRAAISTERDRGPLDAPDEP